jgi:NIMA (never in mitosis gene a)-related kinase
MKYYAKGDLKSLLKRRKESNSHFTIYEICKYMKQMTEALTFMHDNEFMHRDLKPENCFISDDDDVLLGDFGLATSMENKVQSAVAGTLKYMCPTMIIDKQYSYSADIWSLGCIFHEMAVLHYDKVYYKELFTNTNFHDSIHQDISKHYPTSIADLIVSILQEKPENRPSLSAILETVAKVEQDNNSTDILYYKQLASFFEKHHRKY